MGQGTRIDMGIHLGDTKILWIQRYTHDMGWYTIVWGWGYKNTKIQGEQDNRGQ